MNLLHLFQTTTMDYCGELAAGGARTIVIAAPGSEIADRYCQERGWMNRTPLEQIVGRSADADNSGVAVTEEKVDVLLDQDGEVIGIKTLNTYRHCDAEWDDVWDGWVNDSCPVCGTKEIEPSDSIEL